MPNTRADIDYMANILLNSDAFLHISIHIQALIMFCIHHCEFRTLANQKCKWKMNEERWNHTKIVEREAEM